MERLAAHRIIANKYRLERPIAAGGMGTVWAAWNTHLDIPVAIKFMAPLMVGSHELVARFEREARAAARLRSPHVVQIFEHGFHEGLPFIVMERLEGEDLGDRMRRRGRLSLVETAHIVVGVCRALRRTHAMGIIHRDLKPANVFLAQSGDSDEAEEIVKLLDFGVMKCLSETDEISVTQTGQLIGTPSYMSPEQALNTKKVDPRSDLWSLGIIAYRALTGTLPFPGDEGFERLMHICREPIPPPTSILPELGAEVDAFIARALAIDPAARFQTAREMSDAIKALTGGPASFEPSRTTLTSFPDWVPLSSRAHDNPAYVCMFTPEWEIEPGGERRAEAAAPCSEDRTRRSIPAPPLPVVAKDPPEPLEPVPPPPPEDPDTLDKATVEKPPAGAPRAALGAVLALLLVVGALTFLLRSRAGASPAAPASAAAANIPSPTAAPVETPPGATSVPSAVPVEALPGATVVISPAPSAVPMASAGAAPAGTPASARVSPTQRSTAPVRPAAIASPSDRRSTPPLPARKEGGIGRHPTY